MSHVQPSHRAPAHSPNLALPERQVFLVHKVDKEHVNQKYNFITYFKVFDIAIDLAFSICDFSFLCSLTRNTLTHDFKK